MVYFSIALIVCGGFLILDSRYRSNLNKIKVLLRLEKESNARLLNLASDRRKTIEAQEQEVHELKIRIAKAKELLS